MVEQLHLEIISGDALSTSEHQTVVSLCSRAFEEDMAPLMATFKGETHVLGTYEGVLVSHALWVTRWLQVATGPLLRTAYIEGVATEAAYRRRGFASAIMRQAAASIQGYDLAALSPSRASFYERLGWEVWRGPFSIRTDSGLLPCPEAEGEIMILRLPKTPELDLGAPLSAEWREGELW